MAANTMYETGKCAIDAYFAYENSGGKLNGDVVKGVAGAVVMGGLTAFGIHGAANKVDNLSRAISDPTGCFVAGTQVPTVDGYKNIEDITKVYNFQVADWQTYYVTDMDMHFQMRKTYILCSR